MRWGGTWPGAILEQEAILQWSKPELLHYEIFDLLHLLLVQFRYKFTRAPCSLRACMKWYEDPRPISTTHWRSYETLHFTTGVGYLRIMSARFRDTFWRRIRGSISYWSMANTSLNFMLKLFDLFVFEYLRAMSVEEVFRIFSKMTVVQSADLLEVFTFSIVNGNPARWSLPDAFVAHYHHYQL